MNMIKVSNIMGIDPKPFDPKTYVEEAHFVTDESGNNRRIRLENNIVRWRKVTNPDGTTSVSPFVGCISIQKPIIQVIKSSLLRSIFSLLISSEPFPTKAPSLAPVMGYQGCGSHHYLV